MNTVNFVFKIYDEIIFFSIISDQENPLILEVLSASSSAYCYNPDNKITEVCFSFSSYSFLKLLLFEIFLL